MDEPKEKEQQMSTDDKIDEIHSMIKSMLEHKTSTDKHEEKKESTTEKEKKKTESAVQPEQKADSSKRPHYSFNWPEPKQESALLCDLVQ